MALDPYAGMTLEEKLICTRNMTDYVASIEGYDIEVSRFGDERADRRMIAAVRWRARILNRRDNERSQSQT